MLLGDAPVPAIAPPDPVTIAKPAAAVAARIIAAERRQGGAVRPWAAAHGRHAEPRYPRVVDRNGPGHKSRSTYRALWSEAAWSRVVMVE